jgi:ankyrin repeat protein
MSKSKNANQLSNSIIRAIYSNNIDAIKLWQNKDVIDQFDKSNRTAIFHAVLADSKDMLAQLFKDSPDLNWKDNKGWYPLHYAAQQYLIEIAELLIYAGADLEVKDDYGNTPLWRATFSSNGRGDMIKLLLTKGADPNNENSSGISPLALANTIANYDVKQYYNK